MNYIIYVFFALGILKIPSDNIDRQVGPNEILKKTMSKLNRLDYISYEYSRSIHYFSEDYHSEGNATTFIDFDSTDALLGFKFQLENNNTKIVYNGTEGFMLNKINKTMKLAHSPKRSNFENNSFFSNSLVTLKNSLPVLISDKSIQKSVKDTILNKKNYFLVAVTLENKIIENLGTFSSVTLKRNFLYKIIIDKETYLPFQVIQTNDVASKDYVRTIFSNIQTTIAPPSELSWYYSSYTDFKQAKNNKRPLISKNTMAPLWILPSYTTNNTIASTQLKGKYVLLEFWIKNCGYCIQAVPQLNTLNALYKNKNFEIIAINGYDTKEHITTFYNQHKPLYKTVLDANRKVTDSFGVAVFPQVVLIDDKGKVMYAGSLDIEKLKGLLDTVL